MIKLSNGSSGVKKFDIIPFNHPAQSGGSAFYTINHNLNTMKPGLVLYQDDGSLFIRKIVLDWWIAHESFVDHGFSYTVIDANSISLQLYRINGSATSVYGTVLSYE